MCDDDDKEVKRERKDRMDRARKFLRGSRYSSELDSHNLMASLVIARQLNSQKDSDGQPVKGNKEEAFRILRKAAQDVKTILQKKSGWVETMSHSLLVASIYLDFGDLLWGWGGRGSEAAKMYNESLMYNSTRYSIYLTILQRYREEKTWSNVIQFITTLHAKSELTHHARYLDRFVYEFLADSIFQHTVSEASEHKNPGLKQRSSSLLPLNWLKKHQRSYFMLAKHTSLYFSEAPRRRRLNPRSSHTVN